MRKKFHRRGLLSCVTACALLFHSTSHANSDATPTTLSKERFDSCRERFRTEAAARGIKQTVIDSTIGRLTVVDRVLELDRQQPEFTSTFADYLNKRVTDERVRQGRELLQKHRPLLNEVSKRYGVAPPYLVAFWGLETHFGGYLGKMSTLDSLATLGCDERRSVYFSAELMDALKLIDEGSVTAEQLQGSWAGAMGHMQFMPSTYLRYAVDYDKDGRRDLWRSLPDAMASAANYLAQMGWRDGERWGREVRLPEKFDYLQAGLKQRKSLGEWRALGLRNSDGSALPLADMEASLLVPAGHRGPAFLVYDNFHIIMRWNRSEFYALAVGYMANRIAGTGKLFNPPPTDAPRLHRDHVMQLQLQLKEKAFLQSEPDGILGPATREALRHYQKTAGLIADGFPSHDTLRALNVNWQDSVPAK